MNIRVKILLTIIAVAVVTALAIETIAVSNITSIPAIMAIAAVFCAVTTFIGLYVAENIAGPLDAAIKVLTAAADNDLSQRLMGDYAGEFAIMKENINTIVQNLDDAQRLATETAASQMGYTAVCTNPTGQCVHRYDKSAYSTATLGISAKTGTGDSNEVITIDELELWR
jgi:methyl-accepting chemotaxis protein